MLKPLRAAFAVSGCILLTLHLGGQTPTTSSASDNSSQIAPYTAEFRSTNVRTLPDGSTVTTESTEVAAVDSRGRQMHSSTQQGNSGKTEVYVADPVNHTLSYWTVPGSTAQIMDAPDVGVDTECSRKMKAIDPLHPAGSQDPPIEKLGMRVILGVPAEGGRLSFTLGSLHRTNELWTAIDPALGGLRLLMISVDEFQKNTQEVTKFTLAEPDPKLFVVPAGRQITRKKGMEYYCGTQSRAQRGSTPAPQ
jgi:hypothetical protein